MSEEKKYEKPTAEIFDFNDLYDNRGDDDEGEGIRLINTFSAIKSAVAPSSYTNSDLISYAKLSPNNSGRRTHAIDRISPHCVVGQCDVKTLGALFADQSRKASSNYGIGKDGKIALFVEEKNRSWCTSSKANDQRAVTIECASDAYEPYAMNEAVYESLINLCVDICARNGKTKLLWFGDKETSLAYEPESDEMVITVHRWFANKACPGDWLYYRLGELADKVTAKLNGETEETKEPEIDREAEVLNAIGAICGAGVIASPEYWEENHGKVLFLDNLLVNFANALKKDASWEPDGEDVKYAIQKLNRKGIISTPEYWYQHADDVEYLDILLCRMAAKI